MTIVPRRTVLAIVVLSPLLAGACAGEAGRTQPTGASRSTVGGVEVVRNPGHPIHPDAGMSAALWRAPSMEDVARFGEWEQPFAIALGGGKLYVADRMASRVYVMAAEGGAVESSFGRRGGGPGEFDRPFGIAHVGDSVAIGDGARASLEWFTPEGTHLRTQQLGRMGFGLIALPSGELFHFGLLGDEGGWSRIAEDGGVSRVAWPAPVSFEIDDCPRVGGGSGVLARGSCRSLRLQLLSPAGAGFREITVDRPERDTDSVLLENHLEGVRRIMASTGSPPELILQQVERERERLTTLPSIRRIDIDDETGMIAVWEQMPDDLGSGPASLHLFSLGGEYLAEQRFPESWIDFRMEGGVVYALTRDPDTDLADLTAYRLPLSRLGPAADPDR